ncbi:unnamed protein product [Nyctereutes procyonoides]|uniref:(raccoon dog) hypothetical protein n=1 Tax=Nyctereutes procyonoides TaxID=34880 RepID=A0A811YWH0_NYCPR|nr:unnamed protein product [Nyctereutes procyonoides]
MTETMLGSSPGRVNTNEIFHMIAFRNKRNSKGRSVLANIDSSSQITGKGVIVKPDFSVDDNDITLWVFLSQTKGQHPAVVYMANLALADLLSGIWFPLKIAYNMHGNNWVYGEALCKVLIGFFYGNMYYSILLMTCLRVQRKKAKTAFGVLLGIWVLPVIIPLYIMKQAGYIPALNIITCHDVLPKEVFVGDILFPAFLVVSAYILMVRTFQSSAMDEHLGKKRQRAIKLIVIFLPLVHYFLIRNRSQSHIYIQYIVALCLSTLNSCSDPFVCYLVSQDFRDHAKNALLC